MTRSDRYRYQLERAGLTTLFGVLAAGALYGITYFDAILPWIACGLVGCASGWMFFAFILSNDGHEGWVMLSLVLGVAVTLLVAKEGLIMLQGIGLLAGLALIVQLVHWLGLDPEALGALGDDCDLRTT